MVEKWIEESWKAHELYPWTFNIQWKHWCILILIHCLKFSHASPFLLMLIPLSCIPAWFSIVLWDLALRFLPTGTCTTRLITMEAMACYNQGISNDQTSSPFKWGQNWSILAILQNILSSRFGIASWQQDRQRWKGRVACLSVSEMEVKDPKKVSWYISN